MLLVNNAGYSRASNPHGLWNKPGKESFNELSSASLFSASVIMCRAVCTQSSWWLYLSRLLCSYYYLADQGLYLNIKQNTINEKQLFELLERHW